MSCETRTGSLLATLAASKPGGHIVELRTGVGMGAAWLLHGMSLDATLVTVEADPRVLSIARRYLANDRRIDFDNRDADAWLDWYEDPSIDLAFVDCRPGNSSASTTC
jgi:predicted O-methyltransferase YrrM